MEIHTGRRGLQTPSYSLVKLCCGRKSTDSVVSPSWSSKLAQSVPISSPFGQFLLFPACVQSPGSAAEGKLALLSFLSYPNSAIHWHLPKFSLKCCFQNFVREETPHRTGLERKITAFTVWDSLLWCILLLITNEKRCFNELSAVFPLCRFGTSKFLIIISKLSFIKIIISIFLKFKVTLKNSGNRIMIHHYPSVTFLL